MATCIYRKPYGKTFTFQYESGETVRNASLKRWVKSLAIPLAWQEVEINTDRNAKVLATGRDVQGRKQYIYNPDWAAEAAERKFQRILRFGEQLETMRRVTAQHINQRPVNADAVLAGMVRMMDEAFFRPGSQRYTEKNQSHGLTTLRNRHMTIEGDAVIFEYRGKSGQEQRRIIEDDAVCDLLYELEEMTGYELFDVTLPDGERQKFTSSDLNEYIGRIMGEDFTSKDFRTWAGTLLMAVALAEAGPQDEEKLTNSEVVRAVKNVAERLGNTPAICRESYIHPAVIKAYEEGRTIGNFRKQLEHKQGATNRKYENRKDEQALLSDDEKATLQLLQSL